MPLLPVNSVTHQMIAVETLHVTKRVIMLFIFHYEISFTHRFYRCGMFVFSF